MEETFAVPRLRNRDDVRRYISERGAVSIDELPSVRFWRGAGRAVLLTLLTYAALQFYFLHVFVEIMSLPTLVLLP